jgi:formiminotetrahydrofolate cyclodeaminase
MEGFPMTQAAVTAAACTALAAALAWMLSGLSKQPVRFPRGEARCCRALAAAQNLGVTIMSVLDDALARFTLFVKNVLNQVKVAKDLNDTQTARLAELQGALDAALADDAADKATIVNLQGQVNDLQSAVADQINAALDSLENPPAVEVEEVPVVVEEVPVVEEAPVVVEESVTGPVEESPSTPVE